MAEECINEVTLSGVEGRHYRLRCFDASTSSATEAQPDTSVISFCAITKILGFAYLPWAVIDGKGLISLLPSRN